MISSAEWTYLLTTRKVGDEDSAFSYVRIKYGENATDTVTGVIIYPDDFSFSEVGVASIAFGARPLTQINAADWEALENAGCIFLPGMSYIAFTGGTITLGEDRYNQIYYWSATANDASKANELYMLVNPSTYNANGSYQRFGGLGVRLVQDL